MSTVKEYTSQPPLGVNLNQSVHVAVIEARTQDNETGKDFIAKTVVTLYFLNQLLNILKI